MTTPPGAAPAFDLQSHSVHSDGALPATDVVARAAAAGVELLALSDHDTVDGVDEALVAARSASGLALVPATELSALDGDRERRLFGQEPRQLELDELDRVAVRGIRVGRIEHRERVERVARLRRVDPGLEDG